MFGMFTTDYLEKEFGKLRQGSGGTYFITVQQIMEKVAIKQTKLLLNLNIDISDFNLESGHSCANCGFLPTENMCAIMDKLPEFENLLSQETKMTLIYVAGYVVRNDGEIDDTFTYHEKYGSFINDLNRGD